jgi:hypothetical protein
MPLQLTPLSLANGNYNLFTVAHGLSTASIYMQEAKDVDQ